LGYSRGELLGRSWYRLLHPEDLGHVARQHLRLAGAGPEARGEVVTRLQRKDSLGWTWVYARLRPEGPALLAHNFVIRSVHVQRSAPLGTPKWPQTALTPLSPCSEAEAWCLRQQLAAETPPGPPEPFGPSLDFPSAGQDLGASAGPGLDLSMGPGLGDDVGAGAGLGLGVSVGCGLGADVGHGLGAALGAGVEP
ncbi:NPAS4 protein, partial [Rhagologus leucostigma]|nr:NPAS4 protein [Rhagologus leucostigma]